MKNLDLLQITFQRTTYQIPFSSILYIESNLRKIKIHTPTSVYTCYESLTGILKQLPEYKFSRCHQSYIISLEKVTDFYTNQVMIDDISIPVSTKYREGIRLQLANNYDVEMRGKTLKVNTANINPTATGSLTCIKGPYKGVTYHLQPNKTILIGRDGDTVDLVINLAYISRVHCNIKFLEKDNVYEIRDYSRYGTFANGTRLLPHESYRLQRNSIISFGESNIEFKLN